MPSLPRNKSPDIQHRNENVKLKSFHDTYKATTLSMSFGFIYPNPATDKWRLLAIPLGILSISPLSALICYDIYTEWKNGETLEVIRHCAVLGPFMMGFVKMGLMYSKRVEGKRIMDMITEDYAHYNTLPVHYKTTAQTYIKSTHTYINVWFICVMAILSTFIMSALFCTVYSFLFMSQPRRYMIYDVNYPGRPSEERLTSPYYEVVTALTLHVCFIYVVNFTGYDSFMHAAINHACLRLMIFCTYVEDALLLQGEQLRRQLAWAITDHRNTLRYIATVQETFNGYMGFMYCVVSLQMVVTLYLMNEDYEFDFQFTAFSVGTIFHIYVPCLIATKLKTTGEKAATRLYCSGWENVTDIGVRKCIPFMIARAQKPITLKAFGMMTYEMDLFVRIAKSAYSVYTLIKTNS